MGMMVDLDGALLVSIRATATDVFSRKGVTMVEYIIFRLRRGGYFNFDFRGDSGIAARGPRVEFFWGMEAGGDVGVERAKQ